jgi:catechol 2,3-dioxygenase-like lactoylglutathione lyase family enzyme
MAYWRWIRLAFKNRRELPPPLDALICFMKNSKFGFQKVNVIALSVSNLERANQFYGGTLGLEPAYEGDQQIGWEFGDIIFMLKPDWQTPTSELNPRVTIGVEDSRVAEKELANAGVIISDSVELYDEKFLIGSFLDSEGNKLWFCSKQ